MACIDLQGVQARLQSPSCGNENLGDLNKNLTYFKNVLDKLTDETTTLETQAKDTTRSPSISAVLVQTADVHNLRVTANVAVKNVVELLNTSQKDKPCLATNPQDIAATSKCIIQFSMKFLTQFQIFTTKLIHRAGNECRDRGILGQGHQRHIIRVQGNLRRGGEDEI